MTLIAPKIFFREPHDKNFFEKNEVKAQLGSSEHIMIQITPKDDSSTTTGAASMKAVKRVWNQREEVETAIRSLAEEARKEITEIHKELADGATPSLVRRINILLDNIKLFNGYVKKQGLEAAGPKNATSVYIDRAEFKELEKFAVNKDVASSSDSGLLFNTTQMLLQADKASFTIRQTLNQPYKIQKKKEIIKLACMECLKPIETIAPKYNKFPQKKNFITVKLNELNQLTKKIDEAESSGELEKAAEVTERLAEEGSSLLPAGDLVFTTTDSTGVVRNLTTAETLEDALKQTRSCIIGLRSLLNQASESNPGLRDLSKNLEKTSLLALEKNLRIQEGLMRSTTLNYDKMIDAQNKILSSVMKLSQDVRALSLQCQDEESKKKLIDTSTLLSSASYAGLAMLNSKDPSLLSHAPLQKVKEKIDQAQECIESGDLDALFHLDANEKTEKSGGILNWIKSNPGKAALLAGSAVALGLTLYYGSSYIFGKSQVQENLTQASQAQPSIQSEVIDQASKVGSSLKKLTGNFGQDFQDANMSQATIKKEGWSSFLKFWEENWTKEGYEPPPIRLPQTDGDGPLYVDFAKMKAFVSANPGKSIDTIKDLSQFKYSSMVESAASTLAQAGNTAMEAAAQVGSSLKKLTGNFGQDLQDAQLSQATIRKEGWGSFLKLWEEDWTKAGYEPPPIRLPQVHGDDPIYVDFGKMKAFLSANPGKSIDTIKDLSQFKYSSIVESTASTLAQVGNTAMEAAAQVGSSLEKLAGDFGQSTHDALLSQATIQNEGWGSFLKFWEEDWTKAGYEPPPIRLPQADGDGPLYVDFGKMKAFLSANPGKSIDTIKDLSQFKYTVAVAQEAAANIGQAAVEAAPSMSSQVITLASNTVTHVSESLRMAGMAALAVGVATAVAPTAIAAIGATTIGGAVLGGITGAGAIASTVSQVSLAYNAVTTAGSAIAGFFGWGRSSTSSWKPW